MDDVRDRPTALPVEIDARRGQEARTREVALDLVDREPQRRLRVRELMLLVEHAGQRHSDRSRSW